MGELPRVVIVLGRCSRSKQSFGVRLEQKAPGQWLADWAFPVQEASARREGYDQGDISGAFGCDAAYPGCAHCRSAGLFKCGCGKVACWDGERRTVVCPWCGGQGEVRGAIESLSAGGDR